VDEAPDALRRHPDQVQQLAIALGSALKTLAAI
jgi:hypothetical protein